MKPYLTLEQAREAASDTGKLGELIGVPYEAWALRCHEISFKLLSSGAFGPGRIARGWAESVKGQHSWIVLGPDVYHPAVPVVDPTIWFYLRAAGREGMLDGILVARASQLSHTPHGRGSIWTGRNKPGPAEGEIIELTPSFEMSADAKFFLSGDILGPLDYRGWMQLANGPMEQWPAAEIIRAMHDTPALRSLVPVDILGMLTSLNPDKCYLTEDLELRPS